IEWLPTARAAVANVATPLAFSVAVPRLVVPSRKVTVPVGVPVAGATAVTVAVKVTDWPNTTGLADEVSAVLLLLAAFTVSVRVPEVLVAKFVSPPKAAVIAWLPTVRAAVANVAVPPLRVAVPRVVVPSLKVTVPVGVPAPGATALTV